MIFGEFSTRSINHVSFRENRVSVTKSTSEAHVRVFLTILVSGKHVSSMENNVSPKGNYVSFGENHVSFSGKLVSFSGNQVSFSGNHVSFRGNRVSTSVFGTCLLGARTTCGRVALILLHKIRKLFVKNTHYAKWGPDIFFSDFS